MIKKYINDLLIWGWSQQELADECETSQPTISRWSKKDYETDYKSFKKVEELWTAEKKKSEKRQSRS